jgi:putative membrane protein
VAIDADAEKEFEKLDIGAFERTRVAYERTMLAWVRTATSLITFGFSIYKFFQLTPVGRAHEGRIIGSRGFSFMLVIIGLTSLALASLDYRGNLRALGAHQRHQRRSLSVLVAGMVSVAGTLALVVMIFRG